MKLVEIDITDEILLCYTYEVDGGRCQTEKCCDVIDMILAEVVVMQMMV